jgi:acetoin utilization deacetylase AcuC-like enzyme
LDAIPVFYSEHMLAETDSFSPSAGKPRHVLHAWNKARLPIAVRPFAPASALDLCLAHDPVYVRGILDGTLPNGFGNHSLQVAGSLPYTTGAMMAAARLALSSGCACAPVSGFHHAHSDSAGGYCTFNGLMVAAQKLLAQGAVQRVLILDCDMHYGDGTDQILERLALRDAVTNATFGLWFNEPSEAREYLGRLRETVDRFDAYDLVLYQAGADVHVDDPLGGVLSTEEMIERDRIVFDAARTSGTPVAWNLAGGYQEPLAKVIELHVNTMKECVKTFGLPRGWHHFSRSRGYDTVGKYAGNGRHRSGRAQPQGCFGSDLDGCTSR